MVSRSLTKLSTNRVTAPVLAGRDCSGLTATRHNELSQAPAPSSIERGSDLAPATINVVTVMISGPMSGIAEFNRPAFNLMAHELEIAGYRTLNPARQPGGLSWEEYMRRSIIDVCQADAVVVLPGWEASPGATIEVRLARELSIPLLTAGEWRQAGFCATTLAS